MNEHDSTGWCDRGEHGSCDGTLRAGTGHRWWCICLCHPTPTPLWDTPDARKALARWNEKRVALRAVSSEAPA